VFFATDIANFLACRHLMTLDRAHAAGEIQKPVFHDLRLPHPWATDVRYAYEGIVLPDTEDWPDEAPPSFSVTPPALMTPAVPPAPPGTPAAWRSR
jgi:hypothetical protein